MQSRRNLSALSRKRTLVVFWRATVYLKISEILTFLRTLNNHESPNKIEVYGLLFVIRVFMLMSKKKFRQTTTRVDCISSAVHVCKEYDVLVFDVFR